MNITIKARAIPSKPRSGNYPIGSVVSSGRGGGTTVVTGGGVNIDILKVNDTQSLTDKNVLSSLRTLLEICSRIIKKDDKIEYTDDNVLSSLRTIKEVDDKIKALLLELERRYIHKDQDDRTEHSLEVGENLTVEGLLSALGGLDVKGLLKASGGIVSNDLIQAIKGMNIGNFVTGMIGGSGGSVTVDEKTGKTVLEVDKAIFREEMVTPKITFNCIDVISGDKANTFAFGTIKSVDTANRIIELDLLEG